MGLFSWSYGQYDLCLSREVDSLAILLLEQCDFPLGESRLEQPTWMFPFGVAHFGPWVACECLSLCDMPGLCKEQIVLLDALSKDCCPPDMQIDRDFLLSLTHVAQLCKRRGVVGEVACQASDLVRAVSNEPNCAGQTCQNG
eukprot:550546-Amphidinium_carterae.1